MPKIAFLPFNVAEPVRPALGRQLCHFVSEALKVQPDVEVNYVSYLAQVGTQESPEAAFVNIGEDLNDAEFIKQIVSQSSADYVVDGVIKSDEDKYILTLRVTGKNGSEFMDSRKFAISDLFDVIRWLVKGVAEGCSLTLLPEFAQRMEFGTDDPQTFLDFMMGYDGIAYIQQAGGQVAKEFDVSLAFDSLLTAVQRDTDFLGPYEAALTLAQLCAQNGVGNFEVVEQKLRRLSELVPDDWRAYFAIGDLLQAAGRVSEAADRFEKAIRVLDEAKTSALDKKSKGEDVDVPQVEPSLYTRLGLAQQQLGMVANAERTYKKAIEMEGPEKPSMDWLAALLSNQGRSHEVPALWKEQLDKNPDAPHLWSKYALALMQDKREEEGRRAFEEGLQRTNDSFVVKRFYAPYLASKNELDRAMDFYEDVLDETPEDVPTLLEYAQTLMNAERLHEVPDVLKKVLNTNPDPDTAAQTKAWLYEVENPKRIESLRRAQELMEKEDFPGAIAEIEPVVEWMKDYWKAWAMLSTLYNRLQRFSDAERAAQMVLQIFPGCEPAYGELTAALVGQNRAEEAYNMLTAVLRARPTSWPIALNLAMAAKQTGRRDEATRLAKQLREAAGPGNVEVEQVLSELERG